MQQGWRGIGKWHSKTIHHSRYSLIECLSVGDADTLLHILYMVSFYPHTASWSGDPYYLSFSDEGVENINITTAPCRFLVPWRKQSWWSPILWPDSQNLAKSLAWHRGCVRALDPGSPEFRSFFVRESRWTRQRGLPSLSVLTCKNNDSYTVRCEITVKN